MTMGGRRSQAYLAVAGMRNTRDQDADVFRRASGALRSSVTRTELDRVRALADNRRLWLTVSALMKDPENPLPPVLRAGIISVGLAVEREMDRISPDLPFLININENIIAGLAGES